MVDGKSDRDVAKCISTAGAGRSVDELLQHAIGDAPVYAAKLSGEDGPRTTIHLIAPGEHYDEATRSVVERLLELSAARRLDEGLGIEVWRRSAFGRVPGRLCWVAPRGGPHGGASVYG